MWEKQGTRDCSTSRDRSNAMRGLAFSNGHGWYCNPLSPAFPRTTAGLLGPFFGHVAYIDWR